MASTFSWEIDTLFTYIWETVGETRGDLYVYQNVSKYMGDYGRPGETCMCIKGYQTVSKCISVSKYIKLYQNVLVYQTVFSV